MQGSEPDPTSQNQNQPNGDIHLVLGGARSGKSRHAQYLARQTELTRSSPVVYVASCRTGGLDAEMQARIALHRQERPLHWHTAEDRFDWEQLFAEHAGHIALVDCVTLWLAHWQEQGEPETEILRRLEAGITAARKHLRSLILVSNELGHGLVPADAASRAFRDLNGRANQKIAARADHVEYIIAGLPLTLK